MLYTGMNLKECLWKVLVDKVNLTDPERLEWLEDPAPDFFNDLGFLRILTKEMGYKVDIGQADGKLSLHLTSS